MLKNLKHGGYQRGLASVAYKCFGKNSSTGANKRILCQTINQLKNYISQLLKKFKNQKLYSNFKDNICAADLVDIQLSKFNRGIRFLL